MEAGSLAVRSALLVLLIFVLCGQLWVIVLVVLILSSRLVSLVHEAIDCVNFIDNDNYLGTEEGEYYLSSIKDLPYEDVS